MSIQHLSKLKDNQNKLKHILNEIQESFSTMEFCKFDEQKIQLKSISKSIEELEKSKVQVPNELRELKNQLVSDISVQEELEALKLQIVNELEGFIAANSFGKSNGASRTRRINGEIPQIILQTIEVVQQMWKYNYDVAQACKTVGRKRGVTENSVRANCTRNINLSTEQFRKLAKNKENLINHLTNIFPQHSEYIINNIK